MLLVARKLVIYLLIAHFAIISVAGEGLHWIPGMGHAVPVGNSYLLLGIALPHADRSADTRPRVDRSDGQNIPIYDEDQCAICSVMRQTCTSNHAPPAILVLQLVQELVPVVSIRVPTAPGHSFQARAPPLV